jgi:hemerythrin
MQTDIPYQNIEIITVSASDFNINHTKKSVVVKGRLIESLESFDDHHFKGIENLLTECGWNKITVHIKIN